MIVPARRLLDACNRHAVDLATGLATMKGVWVNPPKPHTNRFHVRLEAPADAVTEARDAIAVAQKCWLFGIARPVEVPG